MKILMLMAIMIVSFAAFAPTLHGQDINLATLSADDVKAIRKIIADRDFWKGVADDRQTQITALQESSVGWQKLFLSEKSRADNIQGGRITESQAANEDLKKANIELHNQHAADIIKIGEQNAEIIKLKGDRKWIFGAGIVVGGVGEYLINRQFNKPVAVPTALVRMATRPQFGLKLRF